MGCPWSKCCGESYETETTKSQTQSEAPTIQLEQPRVLVISEPKVPERKFEHECLDEHNRFRALHGCPPLQLDESMSKYAAEWARNIANQNVMQHRPNNKYGENIFWASGKEASGKDVVASWYDEVKHYNFRNGGFSSNTGHFTQVVWKSSKRLGVGVERRGASTWVVANYDPAGNFSGEYKENVPPRKR